jgi:hypothetical protein
MKPVPEIHLLFAGLLIAGRQEQISGLYYVEAASIRTRLEPLRFWHFFNLQECVRESVHILVGAG